MPLQITATFPDLSRAIRRASARQIEARAVRYGEQMVSTVQNLTGRYHQRPSNRRRSPSSQHITDGWSYKIAGDPTNYPLFVNLIASGDSDYLARIRYLNDGTGGHIIRKRQGRSKGGQFGKKGMLQFPPHGNIDGPPWVYRKQVSHPGHAGDHFIRGTRSIDVGTASARFG